MKQSKKEEEGKKKKLGGISKNSYWKQHNTTMLAKTLEHTCEGCCTHTGAAREENV